MFKICWNHYLIPSLIRKSVLVITMILMMCPLFFGCASTNVKSFENCSHIQLENDEKGMWDVANEIESFLNKNANIYEKKNVNDYLTELANSISPIKTIKFRVKVLDDRIPNAFALPNGAIYINSGLIGRMESEDELVTILGHEMAHVILRHSLKKVRNLKNKACLYQTFSMGLFVGGVAIGSGGLVNSAGGRLGYLITLAAIQGYSRETEAQADEYGLNLMIKNGYDPDKGIKIYYKLLDETKDQKNKVPYFFASHPKVEQRIKNLKNLMKKNANMNTVSNVYIRDDGQFVNLIHNLIIRTIENDIDANKFESAKRTFDIFEKYLSDDPQIECLRGLFHFEKSDHSKSKKVFSHLVQKYPDFCTCTCCPYKYLGLMALKQKQIEYALQNFKRYTELGTSCNDYDFFVYKINTLERGR